MTDEEMCVLEVRIAEVDRHLDTWRHVATGLDERRMLREAQEDRRLFLAELREIRRSTDPLA